MSACIEFNTTFIERHCKRCGWEGQPVTKGAPNEIHGHRLVCPDCGAFLAWGGKVKQIKDKSGLRQVSTQWTSKRLGIDECQLCRRSRELVEACNDSLEAHHLRPISEGGADEPYNILIVCTPCHKQIHHNQTYHNRHLESLLKAWGGWRKFHHEEDIEAAINEK